MENKERKEFSVEFVKQKRTDKKWIAEYKVASKDKVLTVEFHPTADYFREYGNIFFSIDAFIKFGEKISVKFSFGISTFANDLYIKLSFCDIKEKAIQSIKKRIRLLEFGEIAGNDIFYKRFQDFYLRKTHKEESVITFKHLLDFEEKLISKGWERLEDFLIFKFIPLNFILEKKEVDYVKNKNPIVEKLKSGEEIERQLAFNIIIRALDEGDRRFFNKLLKDWQANNPPTKTPEEVIYNLAYPNEENDPLATPKLLRVKDIEEALRINKVAMSKDTIQRLCNIMFIRRDTRKLGRPKRA